MALEIDTSGGAGKGDIVERKGKPSDVSAPKKKGERPDPDPRADEVRKLYQEGLSSIRQETSNYWINYAFLEGAQWVYWDEDANRMMELPREPDKARITINRMASNSRTIMSKATQRHLVFEVMPDGADDAHVRGAKLSEQILRVLHRAHDWEVVRERHLQAVWKGGTAAICVDWDPTASDVLIPASDEGEPAVFEGDTLETALSIAEFVVEPGTRDPERSRWWIKALTAPPKEVQAQYKLDWLPSADGYSAMLPYISKYSRSDGGRQDTTLVMTYYERPNHLNEKGSIMVVVNDQVVHSADWPFPQKDRLNLFVARETVVENRWTGDTIVTMARPVQTALNATETVIMEHMKKAGNARLAVPLTFEEEGLTDNVGEVIRFQDGGTLPQWISPPTMPDWWNTRSEQLQMHLDDIMGVHDVSRGEAPSNIESGYGVSILVEQDTTPVGRLVKETVRVWADVASFVLGLYEQEVTTKRKLAVKGTSANNPGQDVTWTGKDLHGQTTASVPEEAVIPRSRAAAMQNAQKMLEMGLITSAADYAMLAEMPDQTQLLEVMSPDIAWARQENALMTAGKAVVVEYWDDHEAHIHEHNRARKTMDFRLLDDEGKALFESHIKAHETSAAEELGKAQARTQISPVLGMAPNAAGTPPVTPDLLPQPAPPPDPELLAMQQAGGATDEIIAAMDAEGGAEAAPPPVQ